MSVITPPNNVKYAALSYVWGQSDNAISGNGGPLQGAPRTIQDAMKVTLEVGLQYLWVDQYCINQQNKNDTNQQLSLMGVIYHRATITKIAAAGNGASYALLGVGRTPRIKQPKITLNATTWIATTKDPDIPLQTSKWQRRACRWTYQEAFFSRRSLIFTNEQVFFECSNMLQAEHHDKDLSSQYHGNIFGRHKRSGRGLYCSLGSHLEEYSTRELTYESEILNAVQGLFNSFANSYLNIQQYWGIPIRWSGYYNSRPDARTANRSNVSGARFSGDFYGIQCQTTSQLEGLTSLRGLGLVGRHLCNGKHTKGML